MIKKTWEYRIYNSMVEFHNCNPCVIQEGFTRKVDCVYDCKCDVKKLKLDAPIVKIQSDDCEQIETFRAVNQFGNILFKKR